MRIVIILIALAFSMQLQADENLPKGIIKLDGRDAPPLVLTNMDGDSWDIKNSHGHWLFVHFWASWCGPCRKEMPRIQAIQDQFNKSELEFVVINTSESEDTVFTFLGSIQMDINPLLDRDGQVTEQWQPRGLPSTYFVDPAGKLRYLALGGRKWDSPDYLHFLKSLSKR